MGMCSELEAHVVWPAQASGAATGAADKAAETGAAEADEAAAGAKRRAGSAGEAASQVRLPVSA